MLAIHSVGQAKDEHILTFLRFDVTRDPRVMIVHDTWGAGGENMLAFDILGGISN